MTENLTPAPMTATASTNRLAPVALILAVLVPIAGAILGHITLRQITQSGDGGRGLAIAAIIVGWLGTIAWFAFWGIFLTTLRALGA